MHNLKRLFLGFIACTSVHHTMPAMTSLAWQWDGIKYQANSSLQYDLGSAVLEKFQFSGIESVLDLGCGDGKLTSLIAKKVPSGQVIGSDMSLSMIKIATQTYADIPNLSFTVKRIEDLAATEVVDVITSFSAFHLIPTQNWPAALSNIHRALKPGGKALLFFCSPSKNPWYAQIIESFAHIGLAEKAPVKIDESITVEFLSKLCKQAGFAHCSARIDIIPYPFSTQEAFTSQIRALGWFNLIPSTLQQKFLDHHVSCVRKYNQQLNEELRDSTFFARSAFATICLAKS